MKNNTFNPKNQPYDPETAEIDPGAADQFTPELQSDGSYIIPKITMATIRSYPERVIKAEKPVKVALIAGQAGGEFLMPKPDDVTRLEAAPLDDRERMTFTALVASGDTWGAIRYDDEGRPEAVFKSDYLFLPIYHHRILNQLRMALDHGRMLPLSIVVWADPSKNIRGYSWRLDDLVAKDPSMQPINRLLRESVLADRRGFMLSGQPRGLLADLRAAE